MANGKKSPVGPRTLEELAKLAGVSASTVSRALADSPLISAKTKKRIKALATNVGFSVNPAASTLRTRITRTIGLVVPMGRETAQPLSDPFWTAMLGRIADEVSARKYDLLVKRIDPDGSDWLKPIIDARRVDGVIILGQADQTDILNAHAESYRPLAVWGQWAPGQKYLTVGLDNHAGGRIAAEHLVLHGRTRLAYIGDTSLPEFAARHSGFMSGLPLGIAAPAVILPKRHSVENGYEAAKEFLSRARAPNGVFAGSDVIAIGFAQAAREFGLRIPEDIALIGFDDILAAQHHPPLTTIRQNLAEGASILCERLFQRLAGEPSESVLLPPTLILRASA